MMKNVILSTVFFCVLSIPKIQAQQDLKTVYFDIKETSFLPEQIFKERVVKEIDVSVSPISTADLNALTHKNIQPAEDYQQSFEKEIERRKNIGKQSIWISINDTIDKYVASGNMNATTGFAVKMRYWKGADWGYNGTETEVMWRKTSFPNTYNPFIFNNQNLSVFKVIFENKGKQIERISLNDWQLSTANEVLYPIKQTIFEAQLAAFAEKMLNYQRFAMPDVLTILPQQRIEKYMAFPNIAQKNAFWQLQFVRDTQLINFDFSVKHTDERQYTKIGNARFEIKNLEDIANYWVVYAISFADGFTFALKDNVLCMTEERMNMPATVYAITAFMTGSHVYIVKKENVILSEKNKISFDFNPQ